MNKNICKSCRKPVPEDAKFCPHCGTKIVETEKSEQPAAQKSESSQSFSSYSILAVAFALALTVILLVLNDNRNILSEKLASQGVAASQAPGAAAGPQAQAMMESVQALKEQIEADPDNYDLLVQMANSYFDIGRYPQAVEFYKRAYDVKSTEPEMIIDMGVAFFNMNAADSALVYMQKALTIDPDHKQGLYNTGIVFYNMGEYKKAVETWQRLVDVDPTSREAQAAKEFIEQLKTQMNQS